MTATDELRRLLDERGVEYEEEYKYFGHYLTWGENDCCSFAEYPAGAVLRIWDCTPEQAIAATLESEFNPDGLPVGLTISDDSNLLNWRGENYVKQSTLGSGKLTAEQVRETVEKHWHDLSADYDMPEATALPEYSYDWHAIADELNAMLGNGECENVAPDYLDFLCSVCGFVHYHSDENDTGDGNDWAYCPRCGKVVKR